MGAAAEERRQSSSFLGLLARKFRALHDLSGTAYGFARSTMGYKWFRPALQELPEGNRHPRPHGAGSRGDSHGMNNIGDSVNELLGAALLGWRQKMGTVRRSIGVRAAARMIGVSPATVSRVERAYGCDSKTFLKIAAIVCPQQTEALVVAISRKVGR